MVDMLDMLISDRLMARYQFEKSPNVRQHIEWVSMLGLPRQCKLPGIRTEDRGR
jgi:hypothetical protein